MLFDLRDRVAHRICTFTLNYIATPHYRKMIEGSIRYGLRAAANDAHEEALHRARTDPHAGGYR